MRMGSGSLRAGLALIACSALLQAQSLPVPVATPVATPGPAPAPNAATIATIQILFDEIPDEGVARRAEQLDAQRYLIIYQGCDPQAARTGVIDVEAVLREIHRKIAANPAGSIRWGMLDFEDPFTAHLQLGVENSKCGDAVATLVATLRAVRARFPGIRWTLYGAPFVPYWLDGKNWVTATAPAKAALLDRLHKIYAPLAAEVDWLSPSIYPVYDPMMFEPTTPQLVREHGRAWRTTSVGLAKILAAGKPVIPTVSSLWQPNGVALAGTAVPQDQFIEDQVQPAVQAGACGVALWTGVGYGIELAVGGYSKHPQQDETLGTRVWREAFVKEYLDLRPPADWNDPMVRMTLVRKASNTIMDSIRWIRSAQPQAATP